MTFRRARIFRAGTYPEKSFTITREELARAVSAFHGPIPLTLEFEPWPENWPVFGELLAIEVRGDELYGDIELPKWFSEVLGSHVKLAAVWNRDTKELVGLSFTDQPSILDAELL